jgi:hypothetical protein
MTGMQWPIINLSSQATTLAVPAELGTKKNKIKGKWFDREPACFRSA